MSTRKVLRPATKANAAQSSKSSKLIIASCSTLPSRVNNIDFQSTVETLANNPRISLIYIHYPKFCQRLNIPYPEVPHWMQSNPKIIVNECADFGPATKFMPLSDIYPAKSDIGVLLFDDDRKYPQTWIDGLLDAFERYNRNAVVGRHGSLHKYLPFQYDAFNMTNDDQEFLCLKTTFGVIYPFNIFPACSKTAMEFVEKYKDKALLRNDDMLLASLAYHAKTSLYVIATTFLEKKSWDETNDDSKIDDVSLAKIPSHVKDQIELARSMMMNGDFPTPWADIGTVIGAVLFVIFIIIFLVIMTRV